MKVRNVALTMIASFVMMGFGRADWDDGMGHKMHWPQHPDPVGWDVGYMSGLTLPLADDWRCTETGPVTDIHIWYSWQDDIVGQLNDVRFTIYSDIAAGVDPNLPFSHPGEVLWGPAVFGPSQYVTRVAGSGTQGFITITPIGQIWEAEDHSLFHQLNVTGIPRPFEQQRDQIYWLSVEFLNPDGGLPGWKTALLSEHFMDNAVWVDGVNWNQLVDPLRLDPDTGLGLPLDMAFVITTPEPQAYALLAGVGLAGFALLRRFLR